MGQLRNLLLKDQESISLFRDILDNLIRILDVTRIVLGLHIQLVDLCAQWAGTED